MPTDRKRGREADDAEQLRCDNKQRMTPLDEKTACLRLERFFRKVFGFTTKNVSTRFLDVGLTEIPDDISFDDLAAKLRNEEVIEAGGDLLGRVIQLCNWKRKDKPILTGTVNAKIYLAAYMIAKMPRNVFDEIGPFENKVIASSGPLINAFHEAAGLLKGGTSWWQVPKAKELPTLLCTYLGSFKDWKINDEKKLAGRLRKALKGVEQAIVEALETQREGGSSAEDLKELKEQKEKLEEKLRQISGARANCSGRAATVVKTHNVQDIASGGGRGGGRVGMTNEAVAHELLIDSNFKLHDENDEKLVHTKIRKAFERGFWDSAAEDMCIDPPSYGPVLNVLSEIRTGIEGLSQNHAEAHQIREIIDTEHIKSQLKEGSLDFAGCGGLIGSIVGVVVSVHDRMGAAERKEKTLAKWKECQAEIKEATGKEQIDRARAICRALELVLDRVHKIRVDTANAKLRQIAPVIRRDGVQYEQSLFARKLASGVMTLERTNKWLKHTTGQLLLKNNYLAGVVKGPFVSDQYEVVMHAAFVGLVADYPNWGGEKRGKERQDELPETVMLDLLRVKALNVHFHTDVVSGVIMTQVDQEVRNRVKPDANLRAELLKNVADILEKNPPKPSQPQAVIEQVMGEIAKHLIGRDDARIVRNLIDKHVQKAHPVYEHMAKQYKLAWFHALADRNYSPNVPEAARCVAAETHKHAKHLRNMVHVNLRVHGPRYNGMLSGILGVGAEAGVAPADAASGGDADMQNAP